MRGIAIPDWIGGAPAVIPSGRGASVDSFVRQSLAGRTATLVSMHGKAAAIRPALARVGIDVVGAAGIDTDRFGTFTREVKREGDALSALARKWEAAGLEADLVVASEGSFGPHPQLGLCAVGLEWVGLHSRRERWKVLGKDVSLDTNYGTRWVASVSEARDFAVEVGFPSHALVVHGPVLHKGIVDDEHLATLVTQALARGPSVQLETDMRAHVNPTRMRAIARAAEDLALRLATLCPGCHEPGFGEVETITGRPCAACGTPTWETQGALWRCDRCGFLEELRDTKISFADPAHCELCNP